MNFFFWGTIILFIATAIFYVVFVGLLYYWHEKKASYLVLPFLFTFEFFVIGFFIISLISILLQYFPDIVKLASS